MGHTFTCDRCDFEFCSGWSHRAGGQFVVCPSCASLYVLGDGQSEWGPRDGEILKLIELGADVDRPTTTSVPIHVLPLANDKEWDGVVRLDIGGLRCPKCDANANLIQEFDGSRPFCAHARTDGHRGMMLGGREMAVGRAEGRKRTCGVKCPEWEATRRGPTFPARSVRVGSSGPRSNCDRGSPSAGFPRSRSTG